MDCWLFVLGLVSNDPLTFTQWSAAKRFCQLGRKTGTPTGWASTAQQVITKRET